MSKCRIAVYAVMSSIIGLLIVCSPVNASIVTGVSTSATAYNSARKLVRDSKGNLYVVYSKDSPSQIYVSKSVDNGTTWADMGGVPIQYISGYAQSNPSIAIDSNNNLHVVWQGCDSGYTSKSQIKYSKYNGSSWSSWVNIDTVSSYEQTLPSIAVDSTNKLHVVWQGQNMIFGSIHIKYSKYNGSSWSSYTNLTSLTTYDQLGPSIAIDSGNNLHVVYYGTDSSNSSNTQIKYMKYSGSSWSSWVNIAAVSGYPQRYPSIAIAANDNLHVAWQGTDSGNSESQIKYTKYNGSSWSSWINIQPITGYAQTSPSIAIDRGNTLSVFWSGLDAGNATYPQIKHSWFGGASWSAYTNLTSSTTTSQLYPAARWSRHNPNWGIIDFAWTDGTTIQYGTYGTEYLPDWAAPAIIDNQPGDNTWQSSDPGAIYDVDFTDPGGSYLSNAQYTVWSGPALTGAQSIAWTNIATAVASSTYTTNWAVDFASLPMGTNYVSVRAYDYAGNMAFATDVFYIIRGEEIVPPTFAGVTGVLGCGAGCLQPYWATHATDNSSGIKQYNVYMDTTAAFATSAGNLIGTVPYATTSISVMKTGLIAGTTYYFKVEAVDNAGNVDTNTVYQSRVCGSTTANALTTSTTSTLSSIGTGIFPKWQANGVAATDYFGTSVAGAGDINKDGYDDIIVGSPYADTPSVINSGVVFVYSGADGTILFQKDGHLSSDEFGNSVANAGDVNGDSYPDFIVGARTMTTSGGTDSGAVYVFSGRTGLLLYVKNGTQSNESFGVDVSGAGDVNNDGYDDFIIGANWHDYAATDDGAAYVYSGATGLILYQKGGGGEDNDYGHSVSGAGDVNNDGYDDFIIGSRDILTIDAGAADVYSGANGNILYTKTGAAAYDNFSASVAGIGDINGDGYADFIVGAPDNDNNGSSAGAVYVYSGIDGSSLYTKYGAAANDMYGTSVSGAGDVNADGKPDFIVGAKNSDASYTDAGSAYVYSGANGSLIFQIKGGAASDFLGNSVAGAGDTNNDGYDDLIIGAHTADPSGNSNAGSAYVYLSDFMIPTIQDNQSGDTTWRSTDPGAIYNIDFLDAGSGLKDIEYAVWSGQGMTATETIAWSDITTLASGTTSFTTNWGVNFASLSEGTNYVSVRAYDNAGNMSVATDVFHIVRGTDTEKPTFNGVQGVLGCGTGCLLPFWSRGNDSPSGIRYYLVYMDTTPAFATGPANIIGTSEGISFKKNGLTDGTTYYFYVEAVDYAGNVSEYVAYSSLKSAGSTQSVLSSTGATVSGAGTGGYLKWQANSTPNSFYHKAEKAGDVDNDGIPDLIVGVTEADISATNSGAAYVYSGATGAILHTISGMLENDYLGGAVAGIGDVNGDGYGDFIIGAPSFDSGTINSGAVFVISGKNGTLLYVISGSDSGDAFGYSVSGTGDVNGDGVPDIIVGGQNNDTVGTDVGAAYVFSGAQGLSLYTKYGAAGSSYEFFGLPVSGAGDVNNDGYSDFIIGAKNNDTAGNDAGAAYVYSGYDGSVLYTKYAVAANDQFGAAAAGAGDVNNDGYSDFIIGAPDNDTASPQAGAVYVYSGIDGSLIYSKYGAASADAFGTSVSGAGDVNGDGFDDFIVGAPYNDTTYNNAGAIYVYSGKDGALLYEKYGIAINNLFGANVTDVGDMNADGFDDIAVTPDPDQAYDSHAVYVFISDFTPPVVTDNQAGDDTWHSTAPATTYDVDFSDTGAGLNNLQYAVWSGAGMTATETITWADIATLAGGTPEYAADWSVPFASLTEGINYVSVRAYDHAGNVSTVATDTFYLKRDTEAPVFAGISSLSDTWAGNSLLASWSAAADVATPITYSIFLSNTSGGQSYATTPYTVISTSTTITGLTDGQYYYAVVRAADPAGNSETNTVELFATPSCVSEITLEKSTGTLEIPPGAPATGLIPGSRLEYIIHYTVNPSYCHASDTVIVDNIPTNTDYNAGSISLDSVPQTDVSDADKCSLLTSPNRISCNLGLLSSGATGTVTFKVTIP